MSRKIISKIFNTFFKNWEVSYLKREVRNFFNVISDSEGDRNMVLTDEYNYYPEENRVLVKIIKEGIPFQIEVTSKGEKKNSLEEFAKEYYLKGGELFCLMTLDY